MCFLALTLLIISLVPDSVTVIIIFLSGVVARGFSSSPFKVQTTSGAGIPRNVQRNYRKVRYGTFEFISMFGILVDAFHRKESRYP